MDGGTTTVYVGGRVPYASRAAGAYHQSEHTFGGAPVYEHKDDYGLTWSLYRRNYGRNGRWSRWVLDVNEVSSAWSGTVAFSLNYGASLQLLDATWWRGMQVSATAFAEANQLHGSSSTSTFTKIETTPQPDEPTMVVVSDEDAGEVIDDSVTDLTKLQEVAEPKTPADSETDDDASHMDSDAATEPTIGKEQGEAKMAPIGLIAGVSAGAVVALVLVAIGLRLTCTQRFGNQKHPQQITTKTKSTISTVAVADSATAEVSDQV
jgi:hypothetical protein